MLCWNVCLNKQLCDLQDNEFVIGFWDSGPLLESGEADAENSKGSLCVIKHRRIWKANTELGMVSGFLRYDSSLRCYA